MAAVAAGDGGLRTWRDDDMFCSQPAAPGRARIEDVMSGALRAAGFEPAGPPVNMPV